MHAQMLMIATKITIGCAVDSLLSKLQLISCYLNTKNPTVARANLDNFLTLTPPQYPIIHFSMVFSLYQHFTYPNIPWSQCIRINAMRAIAAATQIVCYQWSLRSNFLGYERQPHHH